ncbi:MAG: branched-chain amino acid ABC transporter permease [Desulfobacula sp.]|uniref:branched-chain amino acid ABC transporter permease n=1 Tax=Desulfobacula sp. TaxID=2593537 RepID=UPI0025BCC2ED|nr:branched-chain amino acid ABC transporter permease [Desulfobacula sp.]MCD4721679.1 branched-chain amino acid ABC transporter permease [Desulfobacula sp.]
MTLFSEIIQYAISGITSGSIYAIVGICWSTVFLISGVMNFVTGEFVMLGGMLTCVFFGAGIGLPYAIFLSIACTTLIAILLERVVIRPVKHPTEMTYMLITIASASVIKGVILITCGSETRTLKPFIAIEPINILGATIMPQAIVIIGVLGILTLGLLWFFNGTLLGKALRASSINQIGAGLIGIDVKKFRLFCFGLAGAFGAIAGIVITPIAFTGYSIGLMTALKGLVVAIVGGWSIGGTVAAGLALGLLEGFVAGFISTGWKDALALTIMVIFLIFQTIDFSRWKRTISS